MADFPNLSPCVIMELPALNGCGVRRVDSMNSMGIEPGIDSELIDLDGVLFTRLRNLRSAALRRSVDHVVEQAGLVRAVYRSSNAGGGERVD